MKTRNPKSREDLHIQKTDNVLEVGGGHNPHPRSNTVCDKFIDSNYHRHADIKIYKNQKFIQADGANLPFENEHFDYVICNQVLEHVESPAEFLNELSRVAKRGYIETPSVIGEYIFPKEAHKWLVLEIDNKLVLIEKDKVWSKPNVDLGFLFLTYLPKISMGYKVLMKSHPNFMTTRVEWNDSIEYVLPPESNKYAKYFTDVWTEEMVTSFFPKKSKFQEVVDTFITIGKILLGAVIPRKS